jgi:NAD(P)-dependent dehydrogenase (short-subunit alcohol dehydrogenase family)
MTPRLAEQRVLVTGASSGIGRAVALRFAAEGAAVAVGGRDATRVLATVSEINSNGGVAVSAIGDVGDAEAAKTVVSRVASDLGGLDSVVNNAGVDTREWRSLDEWSVEEFDEILRVNLRGAFLIAKYAIPHLLESGGGSIVHMSSVCAITVWAGDAAYGISKAGLNMLSDHIAVEYAARGIRSNTLMPGCIRTELHEAVMSELPNGREIERDLLGRHPVARFGSPDEVADACVFLCQKQSGFLTGANITIDGAYSRV